MTNIKFDLYRYCPLQVDPNLTRHKRKALDQLVKDKCFIISKANKGDAVVLLASTASVELAFEHLSDNKYRNILQH